MNVQDVIDGSARYAILQGDALQQLRTLPDECVQCIVTSPPYYQLRDYGTGRWEGGRDDCDHKTLRQQNRTNADKQSTNKAGNVATWQECGRCGARRIDDQIGLEQTPAEFIAKLTAVFRECRRVLRSDGLMFVNISDSYNAYNGNRGCSTSFQSASEGACPVISKGSGLTVKSLKPKDLIGIPWMLAFALRDDGWYLRQDCIWHKTAPMPESVTDRCTKAHEYIFMLSKSPRYYYDHAATLEPATYAGVARGSALRERPQGEFGGDGKLYATRNRRSVWTINPEPYSGDHFATFPTELPRRCLLAGGKADCIVLDPFSGRATTGVVAIEMGMRYIGIELHPEHVEKSLKRMQNVNPPLFA